MTEAVGGTWAGGVFSDRARCFLAPNPGLMTLNGTNTWVLAEPGSSRSIVVDPGPIEDGHVDVIDEQTGDVALVLLTHHHLDHSQAAVDFATRKGCAVRAVDPAYCFRADPLVDDEVIEVDGLSLRVATTPGHTADSVSFVVPTERILLSGDMVLGRGTTVVAYPDGQLGPYFDSIERMRSLAVSGEVAAILPAHGPVLDNAQSVLDFYLTHRRERLGQVESALAQLCIAVPDPEDDALPRQVVEIVYQDVDESLWGAAELSVRAQLAYLATRAS